MPDRATIRKLAARRKPKETPVDLHDDGPRDRLFASLQEQGVDVPPAEPRRKRVARDDTPREENPLAWARERLLQLLDRAALPAELPPAPTPIEPFVEPPPSLFYDEPKKCCGRGERDACCGYGTAWKGRTE